MNISVEDRDGRRGVRSEGFSTRSDGLRESAEKISVRSGELVAMDEPTVIAKPFFDAIMAEDSQGDRRFPDSTCADESDWYKVFSETNYPPNQLVAPETGLWWSGR